MEMRCKMINLMLWLISVLLLSVPVAINAAVGADGFRHCESKVKKWASSAIDSDVKGDKHALGDVLFFLHVPRTGGKSYYQCFLRKLYPGSQACPGSYDKLRFDPRKPKCHLLSTHDDYSLMSKLPQGKTSVVTILRNPVDRVISTYELSVEVAVGFFLHPEVTSVGRIAKHTRPKMDGGSLLDIWPWKYLVPWMREDLSARKDARNLRGRIHLVSNNPYDMEDIMMPLHDYINDPIARDIIHNGATFQITGLTNNSYFTEAHDVRRCVLKYGNLGEYVLKVAKKRLDEMLYVGLTENLRESATMFGNIVGSQVISQHITSSSSAEVAGKNDSDQNLLASTKVNMINQSNKTYQMLKNVSSTKKDEAAHGNLTVEKLMEAYESCVSTMRSSVADRRVKSLKRISPVSFTKEARHQVPEELIQKITSLNCLDGELYNYAQHIFKRQQAHLMQSMVYDENPGSTFSTRGHSSYYYDSFSWKVLYVCIMGGSVFLFILYAVNARVRRCFKVKL